jgi:hypothetical protein
MNNQPFEPPKTFTSNKIVYTYIETKQTNYKGEKLSEDCYCYKANGKLEPFTKGNIKSLCKT